MILGVKVTHLFGVSNTLLYVVQHKRIRTLLLRIKLSHVPVFGAGSLYCIFSFYIELDSFWGLEPEFHQLETKVSSV